MESYNKKKRKEKKMKTLIFVIIFGLACLVSTVAQERTDETKVTINPETGDTTFTASIIISQSEDITPRNHLFIINPLKFLLFYNISYFQKVSDHVVVGGGVQMPTISGLNGFGANAEVRIYPSGENLRGFYFAPNISFNHLSTDDGSTSPFSFGTLVGWQWFPGDQFAIGFGIGLDYYIGSIEEDNGNLERYNGTVPALRFDIGYAW
jgi:hypothetical protein